jgi:putative addiction module component (TIGR02574 family)
MVFNKTPMVLFVAPLVNSKNKQLFGFLIMNIQAIEQEVLHLPIEERARLAEKLLSSLDALSEQEIEKLWLVEAQRRASEIDNGTVQLVSSEEVERRIQAILQ